MEEPKANRHWHPWKIGGLMEHPNDRYEATGVWPDVGWSPTHWMPPRLADRD